MTDEHRGDRSNEDLAAALRESQERLRVLTEAVQDHGIFGMDTAGGITWWSEGAARLTGYGAEEVLGKDFALLFPPEDRQAGLPRRERETAAASGSAADENWFVRKGGGLF